VADIEFPAVVELQLGDIPLDDDRVPLLEDSLSGSPQLSGLPGEGDAVAPIGVLPGLDNPQALAGPLHQPLKVALGLDQDRLRDD
jgi:hypothetical protein